MVTIPELWSANLGLITKAMDAIAEAVAKRAGRDPGDAQVRGVARVVCGVGVAVLLDWARQPASDPAKAIDQAFAQLEDGFAL